MRELQELMTLPTGARFRASDLHVHTPASSDMDPRWQNASPADVVEQARAKELEVIAVTDHNSVDWCDRMREAAAGSGLEVFPGVEVSTSEGHILGVFARDRPVTEIREFLVQIGIRERDFGNLDAIADLDIASVAARIETEGGVAIAAHVDREKGVWKMMSRSATRRKRIHACKEIRAFEVVEPQMRDTFLSGSLGGYPRKVTCIQGSDCFASGGSRHQLDAIGERYSHLLMDDVSVSGLRQAMLDPELRVRFIDDPRPQPTAAIEGIWVSGGFLGEQLIRFNDNISCMIGGTGSGKSLTIELIRFALGQQVDSAVLPQIAKEIGRLLGFGLRDLDTVSVVVRREAERYLIQRSWLPADPPSPTVARIVDGEVDILEDPIHVPTFFPVKGFSQSEIIEYAREPLARLSLVDDLIEIGDEVAAIDEAKSKLRQNATEITQEQNQLSKTQEQTKELPGVREQIKQLSGFLKHPSVTEQEAWYSERAALERAAESLSTLAGDAEEGLLELETPFLQASDLREETPSEDLMGQVTKLQAELEAVLMKSHDEITASVEGFRERLQGIREEWNARFEGADRRYQRLLAKLDTAARSQAALHGRLTKLRQKEGRLKEAERRIKATIRPRTRALEKDRDRLLSELQSARQAIRAKRAVKAEELTQRLERQVLIKISGEKDDRRFRDKLIDLRVGSRVQEGDISTIATALHPVPLVKSLLTEDFKALAEKSGIAPEVFQRFYDNIAQRDRLHELYELQLVDLDDVVRIQFAVEDNTYRELEALAHGQKCTVVLMIALAEGDFPLLVDQPEDALHAPWIEGYIVSSLRHRRGVRQCIFATRNANVLVSADAEQILALKADAQHGVVDRTGALDRFGTRDLVLYHVEGGKEAFIRRQEKYGLTPAM